jgi:ABC-type spermidine/putrescine transport system permease subunit I
MRDLARLYGWPLTAFFAAAVLAWVLALIVLPQVTMVERAVTAPPRAMASHAAGQLASDAATCASILRAQHSEAAAEGTGAEGGGGLAVPSPGGGLAVPSLGGGAAAAAGAGGGLAVPGMQGPRPAEGALRPFIVQCERADTAKRVALPDRSFVTFSDQHALPVLAVRATDPIETQIETAERIAALATELRARLRAEESARSNLTLSNIAQLGQPILIPMSEAAKAADAAALHNRIYGLIGLRFERDGEVYKRLGLVTLVRTLFFAVLTTALALLLCYPIAYKLALATPPRAAMWLSLGLVIPYAIVELMRIYAWTAIIDNQGLINSVLMRAGMLAEPVQFKRHAGTVFLIIVYTYVLFMLFPIVNTMSTLDRAQIEAARDLGARPWRIHWRVIIPHAKPGIAVGCIATFMLAAGAFSVPRIISSGLQAEWFAQSIYNRFFESGNENTGAAYSLIFTVVCFGIVALFMRATGARLKDFARAR